jgi:large subunit ribosomal protein L29
VSNLRERQQQLQALSYNDAQKELKELRLKLFNLRLQQQRGEVKNSRLFAQTRKDIARVLQRLTELERES